MHLDDLEAVHEGPVKREPEPVGEDEASSRGPGDRPDEPRKGVAHERGPKGDLMREGES